MKKTLMLIALLTCMILTLTGCKTKSEKVILYGKSDFGFDDKELEMPEGYFTIDYQIVKNDDGTMSMTINFAKDKEIEAILKK